MASQGEKRHATLTRFDSTRSHRDVKKECLEEDLASPKPAMAVQEEDEEGDEGYDDPIHLQQSDSFLEERECRSALDANPSSNIQKLQEPEGEEEDTPTPLQLASATGNLPLVTKLLSQRHLHDPNSGPRGWYGKTALQAASLASHAPIVRALLAAGADVNAPGGNNGGRTALALASDPEVVEILLEAGADVNAVPHKYMGRSPLQAAAEGGSTAIVERLIEAGAQVNGPVAQNFGRTPLQAAVDGRFRALVLWLLERGAEINAPPSRYKGLTALQAAAARGDVGLVQLLLERGAEVDAKGSYYNGGTALMLAAEAGHVEVVRYLVEEGKGNVSVVSGNTNKPMTALQVARGKGLTEVVEILSRAGTAVGGLKQ